MTHTVTYLVGTRRRYTQFCEEHGVSTRGWYVKHADTLAQLDQAALWDEVLFLTGWQELPEWRELYNWAIVRQNLIRLIDEANEESNEEGEDR